MQQLNPSEISDIIRNRIESLDVHAEAQNEGTIVGVADGIIRIHGLAEAQFGEMIEFPGGLFGMTMNLERDSVGVVVLGDYEDLSEGMTARCTGRILEVPIGRELLGRVVDSLGNPIDGKGPINASETAPIEKVAPGVIARQSVEQPVQIGLKCLDAMVPIGRGQRELIIGDRQIGKTAIAIDAIINQKDRAGKPCRSYGRAPGPARVAKPCSKPLPRRSAALLTKAAVAKPFAVNDSARVVTGSGSVVVSSSAPC